MPVETGEEGVDLWVYPFVPTLFHDWHYGGQRCSLLSCLLCPLQIRKIFFLVTTNLILYFIASVKSEAFQYKLKHCSAKKWARIEKPIWDDNIGQYYLSWAKILQQKFKYIFVIEFVIELWEYYFHQIWENSCTNVIFTVQQ